MSKRIVFLADCLVTQKAGIHYYAKQFIERVVAQYPDNQYYTLLPHPYSGSQTKEIIVPIKGYIPMHYRLRSFTSIPKKINKLKPDLVIEMAHFGPFGLAQNIKRATVIHDLTPILYPEWHDRTSHYVHKLFLPRILKNADHLIVNSVKTADDLKSYDPETTDKILVAYPQINTIGENIKSSTNNSSRYILTVGTIEPRKNYEKLILAFEKIATEFKDLELKIVGYKGWKSKAVFNLIEQSQYKSRIHLEGYTTEERLQKLYHHAHAFVYPSHYEGFGLPVLEALGHGLPLVCSEIPTSREICQDAAIYFDKDDENDLAQKLAHLLSSPNEMAEKKSASRNQYTTFSSKKLELDLLFGSSS